MDHAFEKLIKANLHRSTVTVDVEQAEAYINFKRAEANSILEAAKVSKLIRDRALLEWRKEDGVASELSVAVGYLLGLLMVSTLLNCWFYFYG